MDFKNASCVLDGRFDLKAIAHNSRISKQTCHICFCVFCDAFKIESVKRLSVIVSLFQNRQPTQASLKTFKQQKLKQKLIIMNRNSPFFVVISDI